MIFARWRARRASRAVIEQILGEIVAASRRPALYQALQAPDRIDGRFELLTLHAGLVLHQRFIVGQKFAVHDEEQVLLRSSGSTIFDDEFAVHDKKRLFVGTVADGE